MPDFVVYSPYASPVPMGTVSRMLEGTYLSEPLAIHWQISVRWSRPSFWNLLIVFIFAASCGSKYFSKYLMHMSICE